MQLETRYLALFQFLSQYRDLWDVVAFTQREIPWRADYPALAQAVDRLDDSQVARLRLSPDDAHVFAREFLPDLRQADAPTQIPRSYSDERHRNTSPGFAGVRSHKRAQILAFSHAVESRIPSDAPTTIVEWCAGKAHLLRTIAGSVAVSRVALEINPTLVKEAQLLAQREGIELRGEVCDVLAPGVERYIARHANVVALHACGELHRPLLQLAQAQHVASIHLAPCCYNRLFGNTYRDYSELAQRHSLQLHSDQLRFSLQGFTDATPAQLEARQREDLWRLAFDELQREMLSVDQYVPTLAKPKTHQVRNLEEFCRLQSLAKGLDFPRNFDEARWRNRAHKRMRSMWRIGLVRRIFQRPLELLLNCDRARFLEESGYDTTLSEFCPATVTPRNLLISARRTGSRQTF